MDRLQQNQPGTLNASWERDGVAVDPGTVTVTITRDDGTAVVSGAASTGGPGTSRTYAVTPLETALLDHWTIQWTSEDDQSILTTYAEVVGGFHFSIARARQRSPLQDQSAYPTEALLYYRTLAEMALEDICGVAFVPRFSTSRARIGSAGMLTVPRRRIRRVRNIATATDQGQQNVTNLSGLRIESGSTIFMPALFNWWSLPITISYEHGYDETPPRVSRASLELARRWLVESPWDERMTGFRTRDGGELQILTAGHKDAFDIPEVVAVADAYGTPMVA